MFDIDKELIAIEKIVVDFENRLRSYINTSIARVIKDNEDMIISIRNGHVSIIDYLNGETAEYLIYFEDNDMTTIEITKQGVSLGYLESDSEVYTKYRNMIKPIEDTYRTYFEWDGRDFLYSKKL